MIPWPATMKQRIGRGHRPKDTRKPVVVPQNRAPSATRLDPRRELKAVFAALVRQPMGRADGSFGTGTEISQTTQPEVESLSARFFPGLRARRASSGVVHTLDVQVRPRRGTRRWTERVTQVLVLLVILLASALVGAVAARLTR